MDLPYEVAPIDYVRFKGASGHEVVAIFQPTAFDEWSRQPQINEADLGSRFSLVTFKIDLKTHPCWGEPGTFPIATVTLYGRKKSQTLWNQLGKPIASDSFSRQDGFDHKQLNENVRAECPKITRIVEKGDAICFTQLVEGDWPEVHVWNDYLASTGIMRNSFLWNGTEWTKWIEESDAELNYIEIQALLISPLRARQTSDDPWSNALGGVEVIDQKTGVKTFSPKLTSQLLKPLKVDSISENVSISDPGFYCKCMPAPFNGCYNYCLELSKNEETNHRKITIQDPVDVVISAIRDYEFVQFQTFEKEHLRSILLGGLKNEIASVSNSKRPNRYIYRHFNKIIVAFKKPQNISFREKNFSIKSFAIPILASNNSENNAADLDLKRGHLYSLDDEEVVIELKQEFFQKLFCSENFRIEDHYEGYKYCSVK